MRKKAIVARRLAVIMHRIRVDGTEDSEEKREPVSDIDTAAADSLKVLDPKRPIREADIARLVHGLVSCPAPTLPWPLV
jgi:hypothetical protein